jgi:hypothetical protein
MHPLLVHWNSVSGDTARKRELSSLCIEFRMPCVVPLVFPLVQTVIRGSLGFITKLAKKVFRAGQLSEPNPRRLPIWGRKMCFRLNCCGWRSRPVGFVQLLPGLGGLWGK